MGCGFPNLGRKKMEDVVIFGGGVTGCSIARELSRYDMKITLVE